MNERDYQRMLDNEEGGLICLANLEAILRDNGSDMNVRALYRSIYKYVECGPWLSVVLHDGTARHCDKLDGIENGAVRYLLVGSIVEGSDAEVVADPIDLLSYEDPADAVKAFNDAVEEVNDEACSLWEEANGGHT